MVSDMPPISSDKNEVCKGCLLGKNAKKSFPHSSSKSEEILKLIHSDICGPMSSPSLNGFCIMSYSLMIFLENVGFIF